MAIFDCTKNFQVASNPGKVWSYGYSEAGSVGYALILFDAATPGKQPSWTRANYRTSGTPAAWRNLGTTTAYGVGAGQMSLHPGPRPNGDFAILRFTAPKNGTYQFAGRFFAGDTGSMNARVVLKGAFDRPLQVFDVTTDESVLSLPPVEMVAGDTVDFIVGNNGSFGAGNTPLQVSVTDSAVRNGVALVLSGGGSKGDFQLGAIQYLYRVCGISPKLISGTSVGSINGGKLAEGEVSPRHGLRSLERTWYTLDRNEDMWLFEPWVHNGPPETAALIRTAATAHLFSWKLPTAPSILPRDNLDWGGLRDLANSVTGFTFLIGSGIKFSGVLTAAAEASSVANLNPIRDRIFGRNGYPPLIDMSAVATWAAGGRRLRLAAVALDSGELRFVKENGQVVDRAGQPVAALRQQTNSQGQLIFDGAGNPLMMPNGQVVSCDIREGIIASASIGLVFPPVKLGEEHYVDGGHRSVIPVDPVFEAGSGIKTIYMVSASPLNLQHTSFARTLNLPNIASRALFEVFLAEIQHSEVQPRGGWGERIPTSIAPTFEVHSMIVVDPGLVRINIDYGWMRADDAVRNLGPADRLFQLTNEITYQRARIWFNEGRRLGIFGAVGDGEYANIAADRIDLKRRVDERIGLGGKVPPGAERWAQIGEAHTVGTGAAPLLNLSLPVYRQGTGASTTAGAPIATAAATSGQPMLVLLDSLIADSSATSGQTNDVRRVLWSTTHLEPALGGTSNWRVAGRSRLPRGAALACVQTQPDVNVLLAADEAGIPVRADSVPDGAGYTGWLPVIEGGLVTQAGGWVTGVSRRSGSCDIFMVGSDGRACTAARHSADVNWAGWWALPQRSFLPGTRICAISRSADKLDIFAADASGRIVTAAWAPGSVAWGGWWEVADGGTAPGGHVAAVSVATDVIDLFVVGGDGVLYRTMWSPSTHPWATWVRLDTSGVRFSVGAPISSVAKNGRIVIAATDVNGSVFSTVFVPPARSFTSLQRIGALAFGADAHVNMVALSSGEVQAFVIGLDRCVYRAVLPVNANTWSSWTKFSSSTLSPVFLPGTSAGPFQDGQFLRTTDPPDQIRVQVERGVMAPDVVEFVLNAGPGVDWAKEIILVEGAAVGIGRWTISVLNNKNTDRNGLYAYQLPGGRLEFRKAKALGVMTEVSRIGIDAVPLGSRITFTWVSDT